MAVREKNPSFADLQREKINSSVESMYKSIVKTTEPEKNPPEIVENHPAEPEKPAAAIKTVTPEPGEKKRKDVLIGIHVTEDERNELRRLFCSNGFSLATAYRAAMSYLRQDIELGKAYITNNGEIFRK